MEKKTKKLQLRKETIAVLNGQRMNHIIGGAYPDCANNAHFNDFPRPGCYCNDGYVMNYDNGQCIRLKDIPATIVAVASLIPMAGPMCLIYGITLQYCPGGDGQNDTGYVKCPTLPYCGK